MAEFNRTKGKFGKSGGIFLLRVLEAILCEGRSSAADIRYESPYMVWNVRSVSLLL